MRSSRHLATRLLATVTAVVAVASLAVVLAPPAAAAGDDYPWRSDRTSRSDTWGFTTRQCTSFVAWRLAQRHVALDNRTDRWGDAADWDDSARRLGIGVGRIPVPGAVAHWNAGETSVLYATSARVSGRLTAGPSGHVGYVQGVYADGSVSVVQYNLDGRRAYATTRVRAPRYLYLGVRDPGSAATPAAAAPASRTPAPGGPLPRPRRFTGVLVPALGSASG